MFTFATTAATGLGVLAACGSSEMSTAFYGAPCTDGDGACGVTFTDSGGFDDDAGYGSQPDANLLDASTDADATLLEDSGDAGEDAD